MKAIRTTLTLTLTLTSILAIPGCLDDEFSEFEDLDDSFTDEEFRLSHSSYPLAAPSERDHYYWCIVGQNHDSVWSKVKDTTQWAITKYEEYAGINFEFLLNYDCAQGVEQLKVYDGGDMPARGGAPDQSTVKLELSGVDAVKDWGLKPDGLWYHSRINGIMLHEFGHHLGYAHAMTRQGGDGDTYSTMHYPSGADTNQWWGGAYAGQDKDWEHHRRLSLSDIVKLMQDYPARRIYDVSIDDHPFSEETPFSNCPAGKVMIGLECSGSHCDDKRLVCGVPSASSGTYSSQGADLYVDPLQWTRAWFSEGNFSFFLHRWVNGIECSGSYCDNLRLRGQDVFSDSSKTHQVSSVDSSCYWTGWISEENPADSNTQNYAVCRKDHAVAGVACSGSYCDNLTLMCCEMKD